MLPLLLRLAEALSASFVVGVSVFFFFILSPVLFAFMGRAKFVPVMMHLTKHAFFVFVPIVSAAALALGLLVGDAAGDKPVALGLSLCVLGSLVSALATALNTFFVVRRALAAGARTVGTRRGDNTKNAVDFVMHGGAKEGTAFWHRSVVVLVLVAAAGSTVQLASLLV
jgi:Domain of unknown function (DUF4149)